jgi:hypothetical protein
MNIAFRALFVALIGVWFGGAAGCAEERDPITRVQADTLSKAFFVGEDLKSTEDDPEFYYRGTVVDVGYGAGQDGLFTSTYAQPVSRIKWEVTETLLNARLAYERIEGTDSKGANIEGFKKTVNDGQIIASFVITSHFDLRRDYNPTTGEEMNIVVENTTDRRWHDRQFMRVDWSRNLVTTSYDFDTLTQLGLYGGIEYEPIGYYVNDPNSPERPIFDSTAGYFDITTKVFAKPQLIDLSHLGWGIDKFPACMLPGDFSGGTEPYGNCNAQEVTIRHSFKRIDESDYAAVDFDGLRFQAFGIFNFDYRRAYERNYGLVDDRFYRFAARYNIWHRSHYFQDAEARTGELACATVETTEERTGNPAADPNRDEGYGVWPEYVAGEPNGTADECEAAGPGSKCDVFRKRCTLPFMQRQTKTIPWYIGGESNEDLFEATDWAVQEWDLAMKTAVQTARLTECRRTGQGGCDEAYPMWRGQQDDIDDAVDIIRDQAICLRKNGWKMEACAAEIDAATQALEAERGGVEGGRDTNAMNAILKMDPILVLCHAPPIETDHPSCGGANVKPRLGDLRYNSVLIIEKPQTPSSWGIMVDADDPLSGEKVAASINIWSSVTDIAAQGLVDLVRYINGELSTEEVTDGTYVRDWVRASALASPPSGPKMTREEVTRRLAAVARIEPEAMAEVQAAGTLPELKAMIRAKDLELSHDVAATNEIASPQAIEVRSRMSRARGSDAEAKLLNKPMLELAGVDQLDVPTEGTIADMASPLAANNPVARSELRQRHEAALAKRGACLLAEAPEPTAMPGLAAALLRKFPMGAEESPAMAKDRHEQMFRYVRRRYQYAVISHEMGHSIGLRHNFVSSFASLHFRPQYWQLRTRNGAVDTLCTGDEGEDPSTCIGPRYFDTMTSEEEQQMIWMYQHSTVMDYPGDVSQDLLGLGIYDMAAARFFYGDVVSVYDSADPTYKVGGDVATGLLQTTDSFGGLAGIKYTVGRGDATRALHYSEIQKEYKVLTRCYPTVIAPPKWWRVEVDGNWDPVTDGKRITLDGGATYTKCRQQPVDYSTWSDLRRPTAEEADVPDLRFFRGGPAVETKTNRIRVPYSFATDNWADTGNVAVFRHDNGADPYEQMMFLVNSHENRHIFDNFRRNRTAFSVRAAADRSYGRYSQKMQGIAGGIGFYGTIYQDLATNQGLSFDTLWPLLVEGSLHENVIAATVAFDHFSRLLSRPQPGPHYRRPAAYDDLVLRSDDDPDDYGAGTNFGGGIVNSEVLVHVPNGSTGYLKDVGFGGRPLNNAYAEGLGEYDTEYTIWAGSYYDKIHTAILLAESEDRFVSSSRRDFYDARFRAVGMADVLPDGFRRLIGNGLTNDRSILAPQLAAEGGDPLRDEGATGPDQDADMYPARAMGWKSWWPTTGPQTCFPSGGRLACYDFLAGREFNPANVEETVSVDPQIGWEVQKFLIAWTLAHIPANEKAYWLDQMRVFRLGPDADPLFEQRVEWQDPSSGQVYYARSYGMECLFGNPDSQSACEASGGKWVQKGIAARVLEYANFLTSRGYQLDTTFTSPIYGPGFDEHGRAQIMWHLDGTPIIVPDPAIVDIAPSGAGVPVQPCDTNVNAGCTPLTIYKNHFAYELVGYKSVPDYLQEVLIEYGLNEPSELGIY